MIQWWIFVYDIVIAIVITIVGLIDRNSTDIFPLYSSIFVDMEALSDVTLLGVSLSKNLSIINTISVLYCCLSVACAASYYCFSVA